ncbi:solute carrier family 46 member 3-like isoform X2 [Asterias rubens]|nr:solute carrier family 46 member 3-like isoform X2 [Asterias rubens]XP_033638442.1 solute carrier family 46 member 3-like isoform X2 [Asterias rubens]
MTSEGTAKPIVTKTQSTKALRLITVEPTVILICAIQGSLVALRTLYIEHRLALSYNYTLPTGSNDTCGGNHTEDPMQKRIESETALWVMYMKGISDFLPAFVAVFYGAASDFIGRKPVLIVSAVAHLTASAIFLSVCYFNLPLICLVVAEGILGICGDSVVLTSTSFAYVTDIYEGTAMTFRIFLLDLLIYVGFGGSQFGVTSILQWTNSYTIAFLVVFGAAVINFLYVAVPGIVRETIKRRPFPRGVVRDLIHKIYLLFKVNTNGRRVTLLLLMTGMVFYDLVYEAVYSVITIFGLGPPFCWSDSFVGVYGLLTNIVPALVGILAWRIFRVCVSEYWMVHIGLLSGIGMMTTTALAKTTTILAYVATAVGLFRVMPSPLLKYLATRQVDDQEQGTLFGAAALMTAFGKVLSPITLNGIYSATVTTDHPTIAFYVAAGLLVVPIILNGILQVRQPRPGYMPINNSSSDQAIDQTGPSQA